MIVTFTIPTFLLMIFTTFVLGVVLGIFLILKGHASF